MALITHKISEANDGLGDQLRTAFANQNSMNSEMYTTTDGLRIDLTAAVTGASGISIVPTSPAPSGTGIASFTATQAGTYTNYGGVVVNANSFAIISRSAAGVFSISQTALDLTTYTKSVDTDKNFRDIKAAVQRNVFSADATGTDIKKLENFILDFRFISGSEMVPANKFYIREFLFSGSLLKLQLRKEDELTIVFNYSNSSFVPPTDETRLAHKIVISEGAKLTIELTLNWDNYYGRSYLTTSYDQYKLNKAVLFGKNQSQLEADVLAVKNANIKIEAWAAKAYAINDQVNYLGRDWAANAVTVSGDVPETSAKWSERLPNYVSKNGLIIDGLNLFNKSTVTPSLIIKTGVTYTTETSAFYQVTDFMDINSSRTFLYTGCTTGAYSDGGSVALFTSKSNGSYITAVKLADLSGNLKATSLLYPTAKYVKFTLRKSGTDDVVNFNYYRENYDFVTLENTTVKKPSYYATNKINVLGDSFCEMGYDVGRGFIDKAFSLLGLSTTTQLGKYAIGGTKLANNSLTVTDTQAMVNRFNIIPSNEVLLLMGGFNDNKSPYNSWTEKLGTINDVNTTTIYGSYNTIINGRRTANIYSNERIILMTYPYAKGEPEKDLTNQAIRDISMKYNLPLIDFERNCHFLLGINCYLQRPSFTVGKTWIDGQRINYNDGSGIWTDVAWSYIAEYIPVNFSTYKTIAQPVNCNTMQYYYNGTSYVFIKYMSARETVLEANCTHIRISAMTSQKLDTWTIEDGEYVTDGTHPNLLGFSRMTPILIEALKSIM
jgi:hypothetical protein